MTRIAITGATGFVGGSVAAVLSDKGHDVTCFVRRDPGPLFPWPWKVVDTSNTEGISIALAGQEAIAHLAILNDFDRMYADRRAG